MDSLPCCGVCRYHKIDAGSLALRADRHDRRIGINEADEKLGANFTRSCSDWHRLYGLVRKRSSAFWLFGLSYLHDVRDIAAVDGRSWHGRQRLGVDGLICKGARRRIAATGTPIS